MLPIVLLGRSAVAAARQASAARRDPGLALLSTALAYIIYFRILAAAGATNLVLVTFLIPVTAILLGTVVLGERSSRARSPGWR